MSEGVCEGCAWWDDVIAKTERRMRDAPDRWERARLAKELGNYRTNRDDHLRMPHERWR